MSRVVNKVITALIEELGPQLFVDALIETTEDEHFWELAGFAYSLSTPAGKEAFNQWCKGLKNLKAVAANLELTQGW